MKHLNEGLIKQRGVTRFSLKEPQTGYVFIANSGVMLCSPKEYVWVFLKNQDAKKRMDQGEFDDNPGLCRYIRNGKDVLVAADLNNVWGYYGVEYPGKNIIFVDGDKVVKISEKRVVADFFPPKNLSEKQTIKDWLEDNDFFLNDIK